MNYAFEITNFADKRVFPAKEFEDFDSSDDLCDDSDSQIFESHLVSLIVFQDGPDKGIDRQEDQ